MVTKVKAPKNSKKVEAKETETKKTAKKRSTFKFDPEAKYEVALPEGFNFDDHKPLKKSMFENEMLYFEHRALEAEHKAAKFRAEAESIRQHGGRKERAKVRRITKMQEKMAELKKQLEAQGVDVEALLATAAE